MVFLCMADPIIFFTGLLVNNRLSFDHFEPFLASEYCRLINESFFLFDLCTFIVCEMQKFDRIEKDKCASSQ